MIQNGWKIQLTMEISFVSVIKNSDKDSNEPYTIYIHSENSSVFIGHETDNIIEELFDYLLKISRKFKKKDEKKRPCF